MTPEKRLREAAKQARISAESLTDPDLRADAEALADAAVWMAERVA